MFKKILCPLDGSTHADQALALAIDMAKKYEASLVLLHVLLRNVDSSGLRRFAEVEGLARHVEPEMSRLRAMNDRLDITVGGAYEDTVVPSRVLVEIGQHVIDVAKSHAEQQGVKDVSTHIVDGDPAKQILRCIEDQKADCVIMGSRGLSDVKGLLLGSVSHKVANHATCTCITVK